MDRCYSCYREKELREMERYCCKQKKERDKMDKYYNHCKCNKCQHSHKCDQHDHKKDCCKRKKECHKHEHHHHYYKQEQCKKHDHKCDKEKDKCKYKDKRTPKADFVDFEFDVLKPNVRIDNRQTLEEDVQTPIASITFDKVKKGDLVWLNGVFGFDQDETILIDNFVDIRIYKGNNNVFIKGQEIFRARFEIEGEAGDDQVIEPIMHVDYIAKDEKNVTYTVTVEPLRTDLDFNGPKTFTGVLIDKK